MVARCLCVHGTETLPKGHSCNGENVKAWEVMMANTLWTLVVAKATPFSPLCLTPDHFHKWRVSNNDQISKNSHSVPFAELHPWTMDSPLSDRAWCFPSFLLSHRNLAFRLFPQLSDGCEGGQGEFCYRSVSPALTVRLNSLQLKSNHALCEREYKSLESVFLAIISYRQAVNTCKI